MSLDRRDILKLLGAALLIPATGKLFANQNSGNPQYFSLVSKAKKERWSALPLNLLMEKIAMEFIGTPYVGGTLDTAETEVCIVLLDKLDCVTYFETVLGIAKCFKKEKYDFEDLVEQVQSTRYRNGKAEDYTSRLHYTADWIYYNVQNKVVRDVTKELGGQKIRFNDNYMSTYPDKYNALKANPALIPIIKKQEDAINNRDYFYIPKDKLEKQIPGIQTCDIIAITTSIAGLDYSHIGFAHKNEDGDIHFLHASSAKKEVVLDTYLSKYLAGKSKDTGITVLRAV